MAEDLYSDGAPEAAAPPEAEAPETDSEGAATALLPKSFFPDGNPEPGKVCTVRVARVMDDQVEVVYEPESAPAEEVVEEEVQAEAPPGMADMMG